jgi:predicted ATPase
VKLDLLKAIHPNVANAVELARICNSLCEAGFLVPNNDHKGSYQFKHSYLVETAYNMLALERRKDVHATVRACLSIHSLIHLRVGL